MVSGMDDALKEGTARQRNMFRRRAPIRFNASLPLGRYALGDFRLRRARCKEQEGRVSSEVQGYEEKDERRLIPHSDATVHDRMSNGSYLSVFPMALATLMTKPAV